MYVACTLQTLITKIIKEEINNIHLISRDPSSPPRRSPSTLLPNTLLCSVLLDTATRPKLPCGSLERRLPLLNKHKFPGMEFYPSLLFNSYIYGPAICYKCWCNGHVQHAFKQTNSIQDQEHGVGGQTSSLQWFLSLITDTQGVRWKAPLFGTLTA